jgi:hypothetical protein
VQGFTANSSASGVWGENSGSGHGVGGKSAGGVGVYGIGSPAGKFDGDVRITGKVYALNISLPDKDLAERFEVDPSIRAEPGMLMVIGDNGALVPCTLSYDKRAVGIVSGAGALRPAITLGEADMSTPTVPIAMIGTAHCLVDADRAPINAGDLLTSSDTVGHAMKALHSARSFGAVIGKALASLPQGRGLIPVLVCLQ